MIETSLYFGQSIPGGGMVSEKDWNDFKERYVAPAFPEGSSVLNVTGNWYDTAMKVLITEPTYVIVYYYKPAKQISRRIDSVRYYYKELFRQQSVLRVDKKVVATF
jgi:hypothetical protein